MIPHEFYPQKKAGAPDIAHRGMAFHQLAKSDAELHFFTALGNDDAAMEHLVHLVLLEPEVTGHRSDIAMIAERTGRFDRFADVLVSAADELSVKPYQAFTSI